MHPHFGRPRHWRPDSWRDGRGPREAPLIWAVVSATLFHLLGSRQDGHWPHQPWWVWVLLVAGPVALLLRRRAPVAVVAVTAATTVAVTAATEPRWTSAVAGVIALFTAVKAGRRIPAVAVAGGAYLLWAGITLGAGVPAAARPSLREVLLTAVAVGLVAVLAEASRVRGQRFAEMVKLRAEQARSREEQERRQASEERLRMARELHDVLGHHLSLISVQAKVGLHLMDSRPEQAREALTAIRSASAEALREVRSVLGVLRLDEEQAPRQPAPGLDRLTELTAAAGIGVRTTIAGSARRLPPEVDRAAYRIVQEALTNVRRHAGEGAAATVTLTYDPGAVTITVDDDGTAGGPAGPAGAGAGVTGMRARAEGLGGSLSAAPRPGGGFRVEALLPTGDTT